MIDNTLHLCSESQRKQVKFTRWAVSALKQGETESMTKGLNANEALLLTFDELSDPLTAIEAEVDRHLSEATHSDVPDVVEEIQKHDDLRSGLVLLRSECEYSDPDTRDGPTDIYLLDHICDWLPGRKIYEPIEEALVHVASTPWNSRTERIRAKQQLVRYVESGEQADDLHPVVEDIIAGESMAWDVESAHRAVVTPDNWWEADDLTESDLYERGQEIPQKPRDHRVKAIQTVVDNMVEQNLKDFGEVFVTEQLVVNLATEGIGIDENTARRYYVPEISLGEDAVHVTIVEEVLSEVAGNLRNKLSKKQLARLPSTDAAILGFQRDITDADRQYPTNEAAREEIESVIDGEYDRTDLAAQSDSIKTAHGAVIRGIKSHLENGEF